ncbi:MAG: transglutaminase family protein [Hydrogenophilales bacterium]|nr:transglutaminase family protein [Hydrogenophilales bacterium]
MKRFRVRHRNRYIYDDQVGLNYGEARLLPRDAPGQRVLSSWLELDPQPDDYREHNDMYGNRLAWFNLRQPHRRLEITAHAEIERTSVSLPAASPAWERVAERLVAPLSGDDALIREFCLASPFVPLDAAAAEYARPSFTADRPIIEAVADLARRVHADFIYNPSATEIGTPIAEVLRERHGVCQDFAHLCLSGLRGLGLAARYVSGWLETEPPPGAPPQIGADASHAWIAVHVPEHGWVDFDPTNGSLTGAGHLTLAWGRDFTDVTPLKGVIYGGGNHALEVGVTVQRLTIDPGTEIIKPSFVDKSQED